MRRAVKQIDTHPQGRLFGPEEPEPLAEAVAAAVGAVVFNRPDPRAIFLGAVRLDEHLRAMGTTEALRVRELLEEQSWEVFERQYKPGGRRPYAPQALLGLVLYGISKGVSSLCSGWCSGGARGRVFPFAFMAMISPSERRCAARVTGGYCGG